MGAYSGHVAAAKRAAISPGFHFLRTSLRLVGTKDFIQGNLLVLQTSRGFRVAPHHSTQSFTPVAGCERIRIYRGYYPPLE